MKLAAIFDISAFIWDSTHFNSNRSEYYPLMEAIPNLLEKLKEQRIPIVFRDELLNEIQANFPYEDIPKDYSTFRDLTMYHLTKVNMVDYPNYENTNITCEPSLLKDYFKSSTRDEVIQLINHIFYENTTIHKLLTFSVLWQDTSNMLVSNGSQKSIIAWVCDDQLNHDAIILTLKKVFGHNPKHKKIVRYFRGKQISPFRYFNPRFPSLTEEAQKLLDSSIFIKNSYYAWAKNDDVFIRFLNTEGNLFHGFEINPDNNLKEIIIKSYENE